MERYLFIYLILLISISCLESDKFPIDELKEKDFINSLKEKVRSSQCLASQDEARAFIEENNIDYKGDIENIDGNVKFIAEKPRN